MKKIMWFLLLVLSVVTLSACQNDEDNVTEEVKEFVMEYKSLTHNVDSQVEKDISEVLEAVKPYLSDEWYEMNEKDKRVNFPESYAHVSGNDIILNDVVINELKENEDGEGYAVEYTLLLTVGFEKVEKQGEMKIIKGDGKGFIITYDWEKEISVDGYRFK